MTLLFLLACSGTPTEAPPAPPVEAASVAPAVEVAGLPRVPAITRSRMAASHVLIAWSGAMTALPNVTRTQQEARVRAEEVRARLVGGADFADVAKGYSDDATGPRGGALGGFDDGTMVKPFEDALKTLQVGQLSEITESPFGYHIIRRDALVEIHGAHLIVSWVGADHAPTSVSRTKEQAFARVQEASSKLAGGGEWAAIVTLYSDGPMKADGGDLGWFGRSQLAPTLDAAAFDLDIGATSGIIETPRGYHILHRTE